MTTLLRLLTNLTFPAGEGKEPPNEFRIFPMGEVKTSKGTFIFDAEAAQTVLAEQAQQGNQLSLDYEHASLQDPAPPAGAPAAGWYDLQLRTDGLYAVNVKWTPRATDYLRNGEYRFYSPAFDADRKTKRITRYWNTALVNIPATQHMQPLVAAKAVPFSGGEVITSPWDADAAEMRLRKWASSDGSGDKDTIDWGKYARGFAYVTGADGHFGDFHLPHHDVRDGKLVVSKPGVEAAAAAVDGARGAKVPADEIGAVKDHLAQHYAEWSGHAPWETQSKPKEKHTMKTLLKMLGLADDATEAEAIAAMHELVSLAGAKDFADAKVQLTALKQRSTDLEAGDAEVVKLTGAKSRSEALGIIAAWKAGHEQVAKLTARVSELESAAQTGEVAQIVEAGMRDGKIPPAMKDSYTEMGKKDLVMLKAFVEKMPKLVTTKDAAQKPKDDGEEAEMPELSAAEKKMAKKLHLTEEEMKKQKAARLKKMSAEED